MDGFRCVSASGLLIGRHSFETELSISAATALKVLGGLKDAGKVEIEGQGKATRYRLAETQISEIFR